jgi:hypothetical protein
MITFNLDGDRDLMDKNEKISELLPVLIYFINIIDFGFILEKGSDNTATKIYLNELFSANCGPRTEMNYRQVLAETNSSQFQSSIIYFMKAVVELKYKELGFDDAFFEEIYGVLLEFYYGLTSSLFCDINKKYPSIFDY